MTQSHDEPTQTMMWGGNAAFIEGLYESYLQDPSSVEAEWRSYFDDLRGGAQERVHSEVQQRFYELGQHRGPVTVQVTGGASGAQQAAGALVTAYRVYGHISARNNPLKLRGIPASLAIVPGANHGGLAARPSQSAARVSAILAWFERYRKK